MWTEIIWYVSDWNLRFQIPHCGWGLKWRRTKAQKKLISMIFLVLLSLVLHCFKRTTVSSEYYKDVLDVQVFTTSYENIIIECVSDDMTWLNARRTWSGQIEANELYKAIGLSLPEIACRLFIVVSQFTIERGWRQLHWKDAGVQKPWRLHPAHNAIKYASREVFPSFNVALASISKQRPPHILLLWRAFPTGMSTKYVTVWQNKSLKRSGARSKADLP